MNECRHCMLDGAVIAFGDKRGVWVATSVTGNTLELSVLYAMTELEAFNVHIEFCPYCGRKLF